jgi:ERCC4-type nuclease
LQFVRRIAIDDRERGSGVVEALRNHPNVELIVRRLALGDYLIARTLVVERKTLSDFALSVVDGRLFTQASRLARQQSFLLQAIPEIGPARARLLLDTFGSPSGVASATVEDLRAVEGIGEVAAQRIRQVFHGP